MALRSNTKAPHKKAVNGTQKEPLFIRYTYRNSQENKEHTRDLLTDNLLENLKFSIRKKHRADTAKLLIIYGIALVIFLWYFVNSNLFF